MECWHAHDVADIGRALIGGFYAECPEQNTVVHAGVVGVAVRQSGIVGPYSVPSSVGAIVVDAASALMSIPTVVANFAIHAGVVLAPTDRDDSSRSDLAKSECPRWEERIPVEGAPIEKVLGWLAKVVAAAYAPGNSVDTMVTQVTVYCHGSMATEDVIEVPGSCIVDGCHVGMSGDAGAHLPNGNKTTIIGGGGTSASCYEDRSWCVWYPLIQVKSDFSHHIYDEAGHNHCTINAQVVPGSVQSE